MIVEGNASDIYFAMRCLRSSSSIIARLTFARFIVPANEAGGRGTVSVEPDEKMHATVVRSRSRCKSREASDLIKTAVPDTHAQRA